MKSLESNCQVSSFVLPSLFLRSTFAHPIVEGAEEERQHSGGRTDLERRQNGFLTNPFPTTGKIMREAY